MAMQLPWLNPGDLLPDPRSAWGEADPVPGLLAAGGALDVHSLLRAYGQGVFPWFSDGQPILWWCPEPRMTLATDGFRLHRSLRKTVHRFRNDHRCEIRIDHDFRRVIEACSRSDRPGQNGTWIVPEMVEAYVALHRAGHAHSVETWINDQLVGGLYCVSIGRAVFGESMFTLQPDASKIALAALVALCRHGHIKLIDCQQNTGHLASLGATEMPREQFLEHLARATTEAAPHWHFEPVYWTELLPATPFGML